jgi:hypothetical protein
LNKLVDFREIQQGGHAIECNHDATLFNPVVSTIPKWQTFSKVDAKLPVSVGPRRVNYGNDGNHMVVVVLVEVVLVVVVVVGLIIVYLMTLLQ